MKKLHIAALVLALAFGLCACGGEKAEAPSSAAPVETATPTVPATPTASPEATATPTPTPTPSPSAEPSPEATPEVTAAPTPTPTPKPTLEAQVNNPVPNNQGVTVKNDNQPTNNTNSNQNVVLPVEPSEDVSLYDYYDEVGVAENVPGAEDGKGQKFDITPVEDPTKNDTGAEAYAFYEQLIKEGYK